MQVPYHSSDVKANHDPFWWVSVRQICADDSQWSTFLLVFTLLLAEMPSENKLN